MAAILGLDNKVAEEVSVYLNNTPGVCKKSYIDPMLFRGELGEKDKLQLGGKMLIKRIN